MKLVNSMSDDIVVFFKLLYRSTRAERERFVHLNSVCVLLCVVNVFGRGFGLVRFRSTGGGDRERFANFNEVCDEVCVCMVS